MSADEGGEAVSMPATNGELNPTPSDLPALPMTGKRKRVQSHDEKSAQDPSSPVPQSQEKANLHETLSNFMEILNQNDKDLQLLTNPLPPSLSKPRSKRAKVSESRDEGPTTTIQSRVQSGRYNTVQEFLGDIEKASAAAIERKQYQGAVANGVSSEVAPLTEVVNSIAAFKKVLNSLLRQASYVNKSEIKTEPSEDGTEAPANSSSPNKDACDDKTSLTLFGNPANPKQLYSSAQKSVKVPLQSSDTETQQNVEVQTPLRDAALPNGITTTKVAPYKPDTTSKHMRTFGEVFPPRASLPPLEYPRRTRPSAKSWIDPFDAVTDINTFPGEWSNYSLAHLPSGLWLRYGGATSSPSYWDRRQKPSSSNEYDNGAIIQGNLEDPTRWTGDDPTALQGVYSSFAPSFDSSGAIMQEDAKDLVWWGTSGAKRLETILSLQSYEDSGDGSAMQSDLLLDALDENSLEESVKAFNPEESADEIARINASKDQESKEMDEVLNEVSDLLETLSSYQRIRNLDLSATSGQNMRSTEKPGLGDSGTPSAEEQSVYETLKSSLLAVISNLPPYAVTKLDGDQLADLNISQKVLVDNPDYHGTLEKDDFTLHQERASVIAQGSIAAGRTSTPSSSRSKNYHGSQTGYNQRLYAANSRQTQQYYGGRQTGTSGAYSPGHARPFAAPATPSQRPSYIAPYSTPQYNLPRTAQSSYPPYSTSMQQGQPSAQASPRPYSARTSQPHNSPFGGARSNSPQKSPAYGTQPRTSYMTPGTNTPQSRYLTQQQQPTPYVTHPSNQNQQPPGSYSNSAATAISHANARNVSLASSQNQRGSSSTPQPGLSRQQSQHSEQERIATPGRKQNATPVPS